MLNINTDYSKISIYSDNKTLQENLLSLNVARGVPFYLEYINEDIQKNYIVIKDIVELQSQNIEVSMLKNDNFFKIETNSLPIGYQIIMGIELFDNTSPELCLSFFIQIFKSNGELLSHYNTIDNMELRVTIPNSMGKILDVYRKHNNKWAQINARIFYIENDVYIFNVSKNLEYQLKISPDNTKTSSSYKILILVFTIMMLILIFIFFYEVDLRSSIYHNVLFSKAEYLI